MAAVSEFPLTTPNSVPAGIVAGPDGNLWVAEASASRIARVTPAGAVTEFALLAGREPVDLAVSGGLLYYTERAGDRIGRLDPTLPTDAGIQGSIAEFIVPGAGSAPTGIAASADGNVWFTEPGADQIGRITSAGVVTEFLVPGAGSQPLDITSAADGALWFTERGSSEIGRITTAGEQTHFATRGAAGLESIVAGTDGALWFTEGRAGKIGRLTTGGSVSE